MFIYLQVNIYNSPVCTHHTVYRGYYTVAQTYEVYVRVEKQIHECRFQHVISFLLHRYEFFENENTRQKLYPKVSLFCK